MDFTQPDDTQITSRSFDKRGHNISIRNAAGETAHVGTIRHQSGRFVFYETVDAKWQLYKLKNDTRTYWGFNRALLQLLKAQHVQDIILYEHASRTIWRTTVDDAIDRGVLGYAHNFGINVNLSTAFWKKEQGGRPFPYLKGSDRDIELRAIEDTGVARSRSTAPPKEQKSLFDVDSYTTTQGERPADIFG